MKIDLQALRDLVVGDAQADRSIPPTGITARLTVFVSAAMATLAVFALALSLSAGRVADRWSEELAQAATLRLPASPIQADAMLSAAINVLDTTPGIASVHVLTAEEQRALLEPWFGADLPVETLPIPQLIEIVTDDEYDQAGLQARLEAEVPGAVLDDHTRWREPLIAAASRLRAMGAVVLLLIGAAVAAMITLAVQASLAANQRVIAVLRLVGATDIYIARAFVRRFTLRAIVGAVAGAFVGLIAVMLLPNGDVAGGFLTGLGFAGAQWLWPIVIPPLSGLVAFFATRTAALSRLKEQT